MSRSNPNFHPFEASEAQFNAHQEMPYEKLDPSLVAIIDTENPLRDVGSSDTLLSYGGGYNTAVALREAHKRGGITIKHRKHAMSEENQSEEPYGAALTAWQEITESN